MDAATLHRIVPTASLERCAELVPGYNWCADLVDATTVRRAAMLTAMVAEESAGLQATEEYASGWAYDLSNNYSLAMGLGNTQKGDGPRYKGRTLIQITGRDNYGRTSRWAYGRGLVPYADYFVRHPSDLAQMRFAWVGPAEYWLGDHNHGYGSINAAADADDLVAATYMVNGGQNGIDTRRLYYLRAKSLGTAILPDVVTPQILEGVI